MHKIKGVIFDLGDTLIYLDGDTEEVARREAEEAGAFVAEAGFDIDRATFAEALLKKRSIFAQKAEREWVEYPAAEAVSEVLIDLGCENVPSGFIKEAVAVFFSYEENLWRTYPDTCATLERLAGDGCLLGLISNSSDDELIGRLVDGFDGRRWLRPVVSSAGVGIRKPDPRIFQVVSEQWKLSPCEVVMVGDRPEADILGARLAGMRSVLLKRDEDPREAQPAGGVVPDATLERLADLPEVIAAF